MWLPHKEQEIMGVTREKEEGHRGTYQMFVFIPLIALLILNPSSFVHGSVPQTPRVSVFHPSMTTETHKKPTGVLDEHLTAAGDRRLRAGITFISQLGSP